jgi:hypothetical protein
MNLKPIAFLSMLLIATSISASEGASKDETSGESSCQMMTKHNQAMKQEAVEGRARLDERLADLEAATGEARVVALTALVREIALQQTATQMHMAQMQPNMMRHMAEHMQSGNKKSMMDSMKKCPMMKPADAESSDPQSTEKDEHKSHHPGS